MLPLCFTSQRYELCVIPFGKVCANADLRQAFRKDVSKQQDSPNIEHI